MARYVVRRLIQAIPILIGISVIVVLHRLLGARATRSTGSARTRSRPRSSRTCSGSTGSTSRCRCSSGTGSPRSGRSPGTRTPGATRSPTGSRSATRSSSGSPARSSSWGPRCSSRSSSPSPSGSSGRSSSTASSDKVITVLATIGYALPTFWLGIILRQIFAQTLDLFPLFGKYSFGKEGDLLDLLWHLVLPVLTLTIVGVAGWSRYMRASMLEVLRADYIRTAKAKGLASSRVIFKHAPAQRPHPDRHAPGPHDPGAAGRRGDHRDHLLVAGPRLPRRLGASSSATTRWCSPSR